MNDGLTEYDRRSSNSNYCLQGNMLMVQMNVKDFIINHSDKDLQE